MRAYHEYAPRDGDLVIFRHGKNLHVKRVLATTGESILGRDSRIMVNSKVLNEPFVRHTGQPASKELVDFGPVFIPTGQVFVAGDNRDVSLDSRTSEFGLVDLRDVIGKPLYVYYSSSDRIGTQLR